MIRQHPDGPNRRYRQTGDLVLSSGTAASKRTDGDGDSGDDETDE